MVGHEEPNKGEGGFRPMVPGSLRPSSTETYKIGFHRVVAGEPDLRVLSVRTAHEGIALLVKAQ